MTDRLDRIERMLESLAANQIEEREARVDFREDLEILYQTIRQAGEAAEADREEALGRAAGAGPERSPGGGR